MKTLFALAFSCFLSLQSHAQIIKASVAPGSTPNRLEILMMADVDQLATDGPIASLTFNVGIDATGVPSPPSLTIIALPSFPGPASQWGVTPPFLEGGYWNYNIFLNTTVSPVSTANTPYGVIEVEFGGFPLLNSKAGLVSLINGGTNFQSYFYCNGPVYSDGLSNLYFPLPGVQLINSDSYDATGFNGTGVSSALLSNIVLPVKFTGFDAIKKDEGAVLNWQVENETALTDRYEVERSLNGIDFKSIINVAPKNNGRSANAYTSTDVDLSSLHSSAVVYYRVKQTDKDGQFIYTEIKSVRLDNKAFTASIYPNPVRSKANLSIDLVDNAPLTITLNDGNGKVLKNIQMNGLKGLNRKEIDMSSLSTGNYFLRIHTPTETTTLTVVKGN
jgi:hypothetical protein